MRIKDMEALVGVSRKNIRFYEEEGLLSPRRDESNRYRDYTPEDAETLRRIKLLRRLDVPIDDIRRMRTGELGLGECLLSHEAALKKRAEDIGHTVTVCRMLREGAAGLDSLDTAPYFAAMEEMERGGASFVDVSKRDKRSEKRSSVTSACIIIVIMLAVEALIIWGHMQGPLPVPILIALLAIPAVVIVCVVSVLRRRINEINGGEEDAAFKY